MPKKAQPALAPETFDGERLIDSVTGRTFVLSSPAWTKWLAIWIDPETDLPDGTSSVLSKARYEAATRRERA